MPFSPGNTFFEYRITRPLGQGAFGTVYLAQDTLLDRPVAIKELTAAAQADPVAFQRFLQEARAAGSLNHPNIVTVYALKLTDAAAYLVMEYLPGSSLRGLLSQHGRLPVEDAARIAADVCDGLAAAHAKGIVHRDVKPENLLLTADGRAKVGDFGIAHVPRIEGGATVVGLTQTGFQPGTLVYMSPEQIRGEAVDGRSDVYQAGAILHEMLTGRHYLDMEALTRRAQETTGGNVLRMQARLCDLLEEAICKHEPPDVRRLRPDAPGWLSATAAAMLARQTAARPTAEWVAGELRRGGKSNPAGQGSEPRRSVLGAVTGLFGKNRTKRPVSAAPSQPVATQPVDVAASRTASGSEAVRGKREAAASAAGRPDEAIRMGQIPPQIRSNEADKHLDLGVAYNQQGSTEEAIREFQAALQVNSDIWEAHYNLGVIYMEQGHLDEAIRAFQAALRINPDYTAAHYNLGVAYAEQGRTDEAIRAFQAALQANPDIWEAHFNLGVAYAEQGHPSEAMQEYQAALRINPHLADAHSSLGVIYKQQGRLDEAIREYQAALRINPDYVQAHLNLGLAYGQQGRTDEAIREFQAALRVNPDYAAAHLNLGIAYGQQGRTDEAIREYQAALRVNPDYAAAHFNLGVAFGQQCHTKQAIREYQAALQINPRYVNAHLNLGVAYGQQGRTDEEIREYQATLRINPDYAEAHHNLGVAYKQQGRLVEARQEARRALQLSYAPARELLAELG